MSRIDALVRARRSFRTFDEKPLAQEDLDRLCAFMAHIENPYGLPVSFQLLNGQEHHLSCPVIVGCDLFVGGKIKKAPHFNEAFGYSFECLVLFAQSLGIGTLWVGGTMNRSAFERALNLSDDEAMPCVSPLGYPAEKMSLRETLMRKGIQADHRRNFESLFFSGSFSSPLAKEKAGRLAFPLEMVRLGPSAVNRQPWRAVVCGNDVHFYLCRAKDVSPGSIDMQKVDLGIALCHFALAAEESGLSPVFSIHDPNLSKPDDLTYIATYHVSSFER